MGTRTSSNAHLCNPLPLYGIASFDPILKLGIHQYRIFVTQSFRVLVANAERPAVLQ